MAKKIEELRESEFHQELGQKMCAAFIAQQQGIALSTAFKKTSQPVGDLWLRIAEFASEGFAEYADAVAEIFGESSALPPKFIV